MNRKTIVKHGRRLAIATCALLIGAGTLQSCKDDDDVLTGQPDWLGNSIYEQLQSEGGYSTVLRLIDDLEQKEVLGHTGSKTLFAADDAAYKKWFESNDWNVRTYDQLTNAQKKLLLNNSMIDNAYLIELMSNVQGNPPVEGMAMRRATKSGIYDSVYIMPVSEMPLTPYWKELREAGEAVPLFRDETNAPMIHFLPKYMQTNKINSTDLSTLTNGAATSTSEAWVNGKRIIERDITCKNGYIQKVDGVIESSPNMAQIIHQNGKTNIWARLMDRFSAPYKSSASVASEYNSNMGTQNQKVYTLRYFSKRSAGGSPVDKDPNGNPVPAQLSFDPGWNLYMYSNTMGYDEHYDAGAMIVPTDSALLAWWDKEGKDLKSEYEELDSLPYATLAKLINVNMLPVFSSAVPSKFNQVLNDAKEELGIKRENVVQSYMGCNGVVYVVNKLFSPAEYASVAYPALAHQSTMNAIYWVIDTNDPNFKKSYFLPYLLSMSSRYALLLPNNTAMASFIDPSSYGNTRNTTDEMGNPVTTEQPSLIEFRYDDTKPSGDGANVANQKLQATRYRVAVDENGNIDLSSKVLTQTEVGRLVINKMADDIMNNMIIVLPNSPYRTLEDLVGQGYRYFKTRAGSLIRVTSSGTGLAFEGGWQIEHNGHKIEVAADKSYTKDNGRTYELNDQIPMTSQKSVFMTLKENSEFSSFLGIMDNDYSGLMSKKLNNKYSPGNDANGNKNLSLLDNYNYTVYVPTNASIQQLQNEKKLPTDAELMVDHSDMGGVEDVLDSLCTAEGWYFDATTESMRSQLKNAAKAAIGQVLANFVRYHVQDHSVAIAMAPEIGYSDNAYESMMRNPVSGRFYPLIVDYDNNNMTVKDAKGNMRKVMKENGLYNKLCREYWFEGSAAQNSLRLFMASDVVVHQIDGVLFYEDMKPWRDVVKALVRAKYDSLQHS